MNLATELLSKNIELSYSTYSPVFSIVSPPNIFFIFRGVYDSCASHLYQYKSFVKPIFHTLTPRIMIFMLDGVSMLCYSNNTKKHGVKYATHR